MQHFTDYLQSKNLSPATIKEYTRQVNLFISWYGNEDIINVQKKDVLNYLHYLKHQKNYQTISRNNRLLSLRHYFNALIQQEAIQINPTSLIKLRGAKKQRLKNIYTPEELAELADNYYQLYVKTAQEKATSGIRPMLYQKSYYAQVRNYVMLQFFIHQGVTPQEIVKLRTDDINLHKATVTIPSGTQRGKERTLPLHATQTGFLMQYLNEIRPQLANTESDILFLSAQQERTAKQVRVALTKLSRQLKKTDNSFTTFAQLRTSFITYWIQTYGLRKAQYLAGHKSINSTEEYLPNHIEDLAEDISKFNPF